MAEIVDGEIVSDRVGEVLCSPVRDLSGVLAYHPYCLSFFRIGCQVTTPGGTGLCDTVYEHADSANPMMSMSPRIAFQYLVRTGRLPEGVQESDFEITDPLSCTVGCVALSHGALQEINNYPRGWDLDALKTSLKVDTLEAVGVRDWAVITDYAELAALHPEHRRLEEVIPFSLELWSTIGRQRRAALQEG